EEEEEEDRAPIEEGWEQRSPSLIRQSSCARARPGRARGPRPVCEAQGRAATTLPCGCHDRGHPNNPSVEAEPRPHRPPLGSTALAAKAALVRQGASPRGRADVAPAAVRWPPTIRASRPRCCVPPPVERLCSAAVR
ncbi:unnamed protein product, partial [Prorocentrum cordatum]